MNAPVRTASRLRERRICTSPKRKAALPDGKRACVARLCIEVDLISEAVSEKRDALSNDSELKEEDRSVWLVATFGYLDQV